MNLVRTRWTITALSLFVLATPGTNASTLTGGDRIALTATREGVSKIYTIGSDGRDLVRITRGPKSDSNAEWSPDRRRIAFTRATQVGEDFRGDPVYRHDIFVLNSDGSGLRLLVRNALDPAWSPAGGLVAFLRHTTRATFIWIVAADGGAPRRLVSGESPDWAPDGLSIAFEGWTGDNTQVFVIGIDGQGQRRLHSEPTITGSAPTWSPDGTRVAFFGDTDAEPLDESLFVVGASGDHPRKLLDVMFGEQDMTANWSPDGRNLLFVRYRDPSPRTALYVMRVGGRPKRLRLEVRDPEWSRDGSQIAFTSGAKLYVMRADGSAVRRIASSLQVGTYFDW